MLELAELILRTLYEESGGHPETAVDPLRVLRTRYPELPARDVAAEFTALAAEGLLTVRAATGAALTGDGMRKLGSLLTQPQRAIVRGANDRPAQTPDQADELTLEQIVQLIDHRSPAAPEETPRTPDAPEIATDRPTNTDAFDIPIDVGFIDEDNEATEYGDPDDDGIEIVDAGAPTLPPASNVPGPAPSVPQAEPPISKRDLLAPEVPAVPPPALPAPELPAPPLPAPELPAAGEAQPKVQTSGAPTQPPLSISAKPMLANAPERLSHMRADLSSLYQELATSGFMSQQQRANAMRIARELEVKLGTLEALIAQACEGASVSP